MLGHIIYNSSFHWIVTFEDFRNAVHFFACGMLSSDNEHSEAKLEMEVLLEDVMTLQPDVNTELSSLLCRAAITIESLKISPQCPTDRDDIAKHSFLPICWLGTLPNILKFFKRLTCNSPLVIKELILNSLSLSNTMKVNYMQSYFKCTSMIRSFVLTDCSTVLMDSVHLAEGLQACKSLEKLACGYNIVCRMPNFNKTLKVLQVTVCDVQQFCGLIIALCDNHTIEDLVVVEGEITSLDDWIIFTNCKYNRKKFSARSRKAVDKLLKTNKTMKALTLDMVLSCDDVCVIANAMCNNHTLQKLNIPKCISGGILRDNSTPKNQFTLRCDGRREAIPSMLRRNRYLEELSIPVNTNCVTAIAAALCDNNSLKKLHIAGGKVLFGASSIASMLEKNTGLKELQISGLGVSTLAGNTFSEPTMQQMMRDTWISEFVILSNSLSCNKTLAYLNVDLNSWLGDKEIEQVVATECARDCRLTTECGKRLFTIYS